MTNGRSELVRRFVELDAEPQSSQGALSHFLWVSERIRGRDDRPVPSASAEEADALARRSSLLSQLAEVAPEIVTGPLRLDSQYWIGTNKPARPNDSTPQESAFVSASDATTKTPSTKPFGIGFFTSTGNAISAHGMWRLYREGWATARHVWAIDINGRPVVREITTASEWVDFVLSHPRRDGEILFPDWTSVARHYDAIHMTLRVIAAIQGLCFRTEEGIVAPTYWDVESTLWLRWCFGSTRLVEVVEADRDLAPAAHASQLVPRYLPYPTSTLVLAASDVDPEHGSRH